MITATKSVVDSLRILSCICKKANGKKILLLSVLGTSWCNLKRAFEEFQPIPPIYLKKRILKNIPVATIGLAAVNVVNRIKMPKKAYNSGKTSKRYCTILLSASFPRQS